MLLIHVVNNDLLTDVRHCRLETVSRRRCMGERQALLSYLDVQVVHVRSAALASVERAILN